MTDEWGPWIEHDGKGCPCLGKLVQMVFKRRNGSEKTMEAIAGSGTMGGRSWDWSNYDLGYSRIIRYRIRRPKALLQLIEMVETLPEREGVDA